MSVLFLFLRNLYNLPMSPYIYIYDLLVKKEITL